MEIDIKAILTISVPLISLFLSVIAIWQTRKERKLSNQHHLWDKRITQYQITQSLICSYRKHVIPYLSYENPSEDIANASDLLCRWLFECEALRHLMPAGSELPDKQHLTAAYDLLYNSEVQIPVLWNENVANPATQFVHQYCNLLCVLHRQANVNDQRKKVYEEWQCWQYQTQNTCSQKDIQEISQCVQEIHSTYNECVHADILTSMQNTLRLENDDVKQWWHAPFQYLVSKLKPLENKNHIELEDKTRIIDIHDKRLSQLFKVCYIAAPGFASALLTNSTLTDNPDIVAKYTIPAIITATAAVVLWIITHALSAGRCFDYSAPKWNNYINHSNETYQHTLDMIRCALIWIFIVFIASTLVQYQQPHVISVIKMLDSVCSPITTGVIFLNLAVVRWTAKHVIGYQCINTILTYLTYGCGLLWTTQVIWNL